MVGKVVRARRLGIMLLMALGVVGAVLGATSTAQAQRIADATAPREAPRVTVNVDNAPLMTVLRTIAQQAGLVPIIEDALIPTNAKITLHVRAVLADEAFQAALHGTGLIARVQAAGNVVIVRASALDGDPGTLLGRVTDAKTGKGVSGVSVTIDSGRTVKTRDNGTFTMTGLPAGAHKVTARMIGYRASSASVTIRDGATETITIALSPTTTTLSDVVTTATGDRRRFEVGNAVGTIHADSIVPTTLIRNMSDLLQARVPGMIVSNTSGAVGAPSKIRLRGVNSISLNNDPIIILDGVRLNTQSTTASLETNVGSQQMYGQLASYSNGGAGQRPPLAPSRLDDIDPNTIESIDVLRGPSASSLYGTDAANGVIVIKTKRGQAGPWRATVSGDVGTSSVPGKMPEMWWGWGHYAAGVVGQKCNLAIGGDATVANNGCRQDSVTQFNPQNNPEMTTFGTGTSQSISATLSGGSASVQQFFSGGATSNVGMDRMSDVERRLIARLWSSAAPSWMVHPNTEQNINGSSRTTFAITPQADASLTTTGIYRNVLNSNAGGIGSTNGSGTSLADTLNYLPSESQRTKVTSGERRGILALTASYRPKTWLSLSGNGGGDYGMRVDGAELRAQDCSVVLLTVTGDPSCPSAHQTTRGETFLTTANVGAQLSFAPTPWLTLQTSVGEQYSHTNFYSLGVGNSDPLRCPLAFGTTLLSPAPVCISTTMQPYSVNEARDVAATAGVYVEETVTLFGVYTTFGVRHDVASAFGSEVNKTPPSYPKLNFSYPISDKSFFPKQPYVTSLRLRVAYGQSGNQASQTAVLNSYSAYQSTYLGSNSTSSSIAVTQLGNTDLKPEKGTEWEGGFDVSFLDNERIHTAVNWYRKFTRNEITQVQLAPSYGADNLGQYVNLGNVENRGLEVSLTTRLLDNRWASWDLTFNVSRNTNKLVHKSPTLDVNGSLNTRFQEGYPLYSYWGVPVESYGDVNGDGFLETDEIRFGEQRFLGAPYPKAEIIYDSDVALWNGAIRLSAKIDHLMGQTTQLLINSGSNFFPRAAVDRTAPLAQQAGYIQAVLNNNAYLGTASTVRLNELSVTYNVPASLLRRTLRVPSLGITLAGRNLALWSSYAGKDPNVDTSGLFGEATQDNALGTPTPRMWALRFNLGL